MKVVQGMVQGSSMYGTRQFKVWYKIVQGIVQGSSR